MGVIVGGTGSLVTDASCEPVADPMMVYAFSSAKGYCIVVV
jgi:hypothetical protein